MTGMTISELAARSGFTASTLRYYEVEGLLPAERTANGYRTYDQTAVDRLAFIAQAKALELPLADIRQLVTAWESEPCSSVRAAYRPLVHAHTAEIDRRIAALGQLRRTLMQATDRLDALPDRRAPCDAGCTFLTELDPPDEPTPVPADSCTLVDRSAYDERIADWRRLLADTAPVFVESADPAESQRVRITLPGDRLGQATILAAAEQDCCPFFGFRIDLHGENFDLTVTAPTEALDQLGELLAWGSTSAGSAPR